MDCPICKSEPLQALPLEQDLLSYRCPRCAGQWISLGDYQDWLARKGEILPEKPPSGTAPAPLSEKRAKLCPQCDRIMLKYKVGRGLDFSLDHCGHCGGVWFDKHEWDVLKDRNLHDEVYKVFTAPWQRQIRLEAARTNFRQGYIAKFGDADYAEIHRIKQWLGGHPQRLALLAYLNDEDPYSV